MTMPAMAVHLLNRLYKAKHVSCAIFCLDTKSAYYRIIRQLAVGMLDTEEGTVRIFQEFGLAPEDYQDFLQLVRQAGALGEAGTSRHLLAMGQDMCRRTWFVTNYSQGNKVTVVQAGSRPGASWADVLFSFVYSRLLQRVRQEVVAMGCDSPLLFSGMNELLPSAETAADERISLSDATWADDTTLCTFDRDPEVLLDKAKRVMASTLHYCCKYGLVPNMSKGKSGLLLALRGKGSSCC